jgi:hypothetical protein
MFNMEFFLKHQKKKNEKKNEWLALGFLLCDVMNIHINKLVQDVFNKLEENYTFWFTLMYKNLTQY